MNVGLFRLLVVVLVLTMPGLAPSQSHAQSAGSSLRDHGLPELAIQAADDRFILPGSVAAGRTLISVENIGLDSRHSFLVRLPDNWTIGELLASSDPDMPPPWLYEATFLGYPGEVLPGATGVAVVDLTPGMYAIVDNVTAIFVVAPASEPTATTPRAMRPIPTSGTVKLFEFGFSFPERVDAGEQVWEVTNIGLQPHELLILRSPLPDVTQEQILAALMAESGGAEGIDFALMTPVGGLGWLSPGATAWTEVSLEPGTYVALCFVFDPAVGMPHAFEGMIQIFTVS